MIKYLILWSLKVMLLKYTWYRKVFGKLWHNAKQKCQVTIPRLCEYIQLQLRLEGILWDVKSSLNGKITHAFSFLYAFLFPQILSKNSIFHDWKSTCLIFLYARFSFSATGNTFHWIYGDCKVDDPFSLGWSLGPHGKNLSVCYGPRVSNRASISHGPFVVSKWVSSSLVAHSAFGQIATLRTSPTYYPYSFIY